MSRATDHFAPLGLTPQFLIDEKQLEEAYFKAQRQYHPDRFVGKPPAERQAALHKSVDINQAYQVLKEPLARAQHLLSLQGITVGTDSDSVKPSQALLVEAMELREEPRSSTVMAEMIRESLAKIAQYYTHSDFNAMAQETLRLGYLMKAPKK